MSILSESGGSSLYMIRIPLSRSIILQHLERLPDKGFPNPSVLGLGFEATFTMALKTTMRCELSSEAKSLSRVYDLPGVEPRSETGGGSLSLPPR